MVLSGFRWNEALPARLLFISALWSLKIASYAVDTNGPRWLRMHPQSTARGHIANQDGRLI